MKSNKTIEVGDQVDVKNPQGIVVAVIQVFMDRDKETVVTQVNGFDKHRGVMRHGL